MLENADIRGPTLLPVLMAAAIVGIAAILSVRAAVPTMESPFALLPTLFAFLVFDMRMFDGDRLRGLAHILAASPIILLFFVWGSQNIWPKTPTSKFPQLKCGNWLCHGGTESGRLASS